MALFGQKRRFIVLLAAVILTPAPALALNLCPWGMCPKPKKEVIDDKSQALIWDISHKPELMNLNYLQYFIGRPENEDVVRGGQKHYKWYKGQERRELAYELIQTEQPQGQVVDSMMVVHLKGMGLTFDKLDKVFGNNSRRFFDYNGHPNEVFSYVPNTSVSFSEPGNSFRLDQAKILYRGAPLPPPSQEDLALAESTMIARAREAHLATGKKAPGPHETTPMTMQRLQSQPFNAEAHLHLAQDLQKQCRINDAIGEYKLALALSGDDQNVRNQSLQALRDMGLLPPENPQPRRNLEIVDHGQRLKVVGNEKDTAPYVDPNQFSGQYPNQFSGQNPNQFPNQNPKQSQKPNLSQDPDDATR